MPDLITIHGQSDPIDWIKGRLLSKQIPFTQKRDSMCFIELANSNILLEPILTNTHTIDPNTYELQAHWDPCGVDFGFMMCIGTPANIKLAPEVIDFLNILAPNPHAYLITGPLGSARFCMQVFESIFYLQHRPLPFNQNTDSLLDFLPNWELILIEHQNLYLNLCQLSQRYLHSIAPAESNISLDIARNIAEYILRFKPDTI